MVEELKKVLEELELHTNLETITKKIRQIALSLKQGERRSHIFIFKGSNSTQMAKVAVNMGKIFKATGTMDNGHVVFCEYHDLVANYVGQTASITDKVIDESLGGFLFINNVSALLDVYSNSFGREAINKIIMRLYDDIGRFSLILCDYPDQMTSFLEKSSGFSSRSTNIFDFDNVTVM